ncbi:MAG: hypothetical protein ABJ358_08255 [Rhizobiaceae bacterium]
MSVRAVSFFESRVNSFVEFNQIVPMAGNLRFEIRHSPIVAEIASGAKADIRAALLNGRFVRVGVIHAARSEREEKNLFTCCCGDQPHLIGPI